MEGYGNDLRTNEAILVFGVLLHAATCVSGYSLQDRNRVLFVMTCQGHYVETRSSILSLLSFFPPHDSKGKSRVLSESEM